MKRIVILGGGENQLPLINAAKHQNYYVIVIDYRGDVPGRSLADFFYMADATNYDEVLSICIKESVDGIISNSEYTVLVANKVATELGLIGNNPDSVKILMSKPDFRSLQHRLGHFAPKCFEASTLEYFLDEVKLMNYPIIVKPAESSGSRGTTKFAEFRLEEMTQCFENCLNYSRNGKVAIEEYIEMPSLVTVEGDIFIYNGKILWYGLYNTTRSELFPVLPMTYSAPLLIDEGQKNIVKKTLKELFQASGVSFGQFNIEGYFTKSNDFFVIEINARQGGNELPYFLKESTGIDYNRLLVSTAVKDESYWNSVFVDESKQHLCIQYSVFSYINAEFIGIEISKEIQQFVKRIKYNINKGEIIKVSANGAKLVGIVNLTFDTFEQLHFFHDKMSKYIQVVLK